MPRQRRRRQTSRQSQANRRRRQTRNRQGRNSSRINSRGRIQRIPSESARRGERMFSSHASLLLINNFLSECEANLEACDEQQRYLNEMLVHIADHSRSVSARQSQMPAMFRSDRIIHHINTSNESQTAFQSIPDSEQPNVESRQEEIHTESFPVPERLMLAAEHDVFVVPVGSVQVQQSDDSNVLTLTITLNKETDEVQIIRRADEDNSE